MIATWLLALAQSAAPVAPPAAPAPLDAERMRARVLQHSPLTAPPADPTNRHADDDAAAHLGRFLFFDARLSGSGALSCASCHDPERAFTDGRALASGARLGRRNAPGLWNLAWQRWYFWDGRADSMWSQALQPLEDARELDGDRVAIARLLARDTELAAAYQAVFGALPEAASIARWPAHARPARGGNADRQIARPDHRAWEAMDRSDRDAVNRVFANVGKAIAAYERRLVSKDSAFDRYVDALRRGDERGVAAYDERARAGLALFLGRGNCRLCHAGPNFTDDEFHDIGIPPPSSEGLNSDHGRRDGVRLVMDAEFSARSAYSDDARGANASELASLAATPENYGQFKTPSLRNVARTAPYMHAGQLTTLREVVSYYSTLEKARLPQHHGEQVLRPLNLSDAEIDQLVAFLESLTDTQLPAELLTPPASPRYTPSASAPAR